MNLTDEITKLESVVTTLKRRCNIKLNDEEEIKYLKETIESVSDALKILYYLDEKIYKEKRFLNNEEEITKDQKEKQPEDS